MGYVVVTVADNGVVHVYGAGKMVVGADDNGEPFESREEALRVVRDWRREEGYPAGVAFYTCKILPNEPSDPVPVIG